MKMDKGEFMVLTTDNYKIKLTLAAITDKKSSRVGIMGEGSRADVLTLLSSIIGCLLSNDYGVPEIMMAIEAAFQHNGIGVGSLDLSQEGAVDFLQGLLDSIGDDDDDDDDD